MPIHLLCVTLLLIGAIVRNAAGGPALAVKGGPGDRCFPQQGVVNGQRVGQKAWKQCVETSQRVYPCGSSGTRTAQCTHKPSSPQVPGLYRAAPAEFPHVAFLGYGELPNVLWNCGGSLISDQWILTAAHCMHDRSTGSDVKHVRLGGGDLNSTLNPADHFTVKKIVPHPGCDFSTRYNDVALLQLDRPVPFTRSVHPGCLHAGQPVNDELPISAGWGVEKAGVPRSNSLNKAVLEKFSFEECAEKYPPGKKYKDGVNEQMFCAGPREGRTDTTCQGDAGGPLQVYNEDVYCNYYITGITSFGKTCGLPGYPSVYARVSAFLPWIESIVWL